MDYSKRYVYSLIFNFSVSKKITDLFYKNLICNYELRT